MTEDPFSVESLVGEFPWTLTDKIRHAVQVIRVALNSPEQGCPGTVICFNGGKDSTVLLDLVSRVCRADNRPIIPLLYFDSGEEFPEVRDFIEKKVVSGNLHLYTYFNTNTQQRRMKDELWRFHREHSGIQNVLLGCRQDDPGCPKKDCQSTDAGWAPFLRFYPLRTWTYSDVWDYLTIGISNDQRKARIPYCSLYDRKYNSIGNHQTQKNLWLKKTTDDHEYYPAWMLGSLCPESERCGRQ